MQTVTTKKGHLRQWRRTWSG